MTPSEVRDLIAEARAATACQCVDALEIECGTHGDDHSKMVGALADALEARQVDEALRFCTCSHWLEAHYERKCLEHHCACENFEPVFRIDESALEKVLSRHVLAEPSGGTASLAWCDCSCGHREEFAGGTRDLVLARAREHQARAVVEFLGKRHEPETFAERVSEQSIEAMEAQKRHEPEARAEFDYEHGVTEGDVRDRLAKLVHGMSPNGQIDEELCSVCAVSLERADEILAAFPIPSRDIAGEIEAEVAGEECCRPNDFHTQYVGGLMRAAEIVRYGR